MARVRIRESGFKVFMNTDIRRFTASVGSRVEVECQAFAPVDTGRLQNRITSGTVRVSRRSAAVRVEARAGYSLFVEEGTGIFGPTGAPITPKRARVLRFKPKGSARFVFARSVKGQPGQHFMRDGLISAIGKI